MPHFIHNSLILPILFDVQLQNAKIIWLLLMPANTFLSFPDKLQEKYVHVPSENQPAMVLTLPLSKGSFGLLFPTKHNKLSKMIFLQSLLRSDLINLTNHLCKHLSCVTIARKVILCSTLTGRIVILFYARFFIFFC